VLAGAVLAGGLADLGDLLLVVAAMVCLYTAGMYLNDVFDYASDRTRRPDRPLPAGIVGRREAAAVGTVLLVGGSALLLPLGVAAFASGLILVALILAYDLWHKTNPLSPVVMAGCRVMVYVTAYLAFAPVGFTASGSAAVPLVAACVLLGGYLVGLTYVAKVEDRWMAFHAKDDALTPAKREKGLAPSTGLFLRFWPAALVLLPAVYFASYAASWLVAPLLALFVGWVLYSLWLVYRPTDRNIGGAIGRLIAGISLLDGLVLAASGSAVGVLVALAAFRGTHALQRYVKGT
jgi:4-hydroxybenzoate polyprenyltransferase